MSLTHTIWVQEQNDVAFDDIDALNTDLRNDSRFGEYFDSSQGTDFINQATTDSAGWPKYKTGDILFINDEYGSEYPGGPAAEMWGMFDESVAQIVANHMTAGRLVVRIDIEGNRPEWILMEPGVARKVTPSFV